MIWRTTLWACAKWTGTAWNKAPNMTVHSLKIKYALAALVAGTVVAGSLGALVFWWFRPERTFLVILSVTAGLLVLSSLIVAWLLARRLERPITSLIKNAERIGQGDYSRPAVEFARRDEIGELQQALERMRI